MATVGTLMAVSPVVELVTLPLAGVLADWLGLSWMIGTGLVIAAVEYIFVAASTAVWQLYLTQAMDACVVAVVLGLGLTYAQRLSPERPGLASSLLFSAFNLSGIVGGLLGSAAVPLLGVPHVFLLPALLCAGCGIAFVGIERAGHARRATPGGGAITTVAAAAGTASRRARR
jgi:SET family sugar efflux transporter-like MFS transporter